ncbi:MAG: RdgB/HAM1 family non-canonical purine NTP pyrophosphatase [Deltaproteobacteria bacterium]|nr:RdgB/HAM1 family non-canonical purine NTP pyrophosphatase [Deltaproteobacteria bacterium]
MEIWIATGNSEKLKEINLVLSPAISNLKLNHQGMISGFTARPEDGKTFIDNARIKARSLKAIRSDDWVLAEDSGLEVPAMGNLPGVHSARYAGPHARDSENVSKLLKMLTIRNISDRKAKFHCAMIVLTPKNEEWVFEGELWGTIGKNPQGLMGFGYDPVFIPNDQSLTMAELGPGFKNQHSHRSKALKLFLDKLKTASFFD